MRVSLTSESSKSGVDLGVFDLPARDLIQQPFGMGADLTGKSDGPYLLTTEVGDGEALLAAVSAPIYIVHGIATNRASVESRLARLQGT